MIVGAITHVTETPEGGPDALLVALGAVAEHEGGLAAGDGAVLGGEDVVGLGAARDPALGLAAVPPGNDLESVAAAQLDGARLAGVDL